MMLGMSQSGIDVMKQKVFSGRQEGQEADGPASQEARPVPAAMVAGKRCQWSGAERSSSLDGLVAAMSAITSSGL